MLQLDSQPDYNRPKLPYITSAKFLAKTTIRLLRQLAWMI